ncbi:signal peptidase I [Microbacterium sp. NIBRBAC000506063]|uniref:signal peptidase I n=1 Tax=Microbacterium sp. NIBRBAC000506063 TaxID=2734618 RepID=UPI00397FED29
MLFLRDLLIILVIAGLVSFLMKTFVVRSFYIPSGSMENTLLINDRILVDELTPRWNDYSHGEIVVFKDPGGWLPVQPQRPGALRSSRASTGS